MRSRAIEGLHSGETSLRALCDYSKTDKDSMDAAYVARLRLIDVLKSKDGWNAADAERFLLDSGFKITDTIRTIRSKVIRFEVFQEILDMPIEELRTESGRAIYTSDDWPWRGKLSNLAAELGVDQYSLLGVQKPEPRPAIEPSVSNEDLDSLLDDDEVDSDDLDKLLGD